MSDRPLVELVSAFVVASFRPEDSIGGCQCKRVLLH